MSSNINNRRVGNSMLVFIRYKQCCDWRYCYSLNDAKKMQIFHQPNLGVDDCPTIFRSIALMSLSWMHSFHNHCKHRHRQSNHFRIRHC